MADVKRYWKIDGRRALHPHTMMELAVEENLPREWMGKANSLHCPRGRHWGEGHFIVSQAVFDKLHFNSQLSLECVHENGSTIWPGYYIIRTQSITGDPGSSAHWITVADRRWVLERSAGDIPRFNLRSSETEFHEPTTNGGTPWTWEEVVEQLWGLLPAVGGSAPALPIAPGSTPENLIFDGMSAWHAVNQVVTAIGCVIVLDPIAGTFSIVEAKATQTGLASAKVNARDHLLWAFSPHELPETNYPAIVAVTFQSWPDETLCPFPNAPEIEESSLGLGGIAGTKYPIEDTMFATEDNGAERTARAGEIRDALIGFFKPAAKSYGGVFGGIHEIPLGSEVTDVIWTNDGERGTRTIVKYVFHPFEWPRLHVRPCGGSAEIEFTVDSATTIDDPDSPYDGMRELTVTVISPSCNRPELLGQSGIKVYEHEPICLTADETDEALIGRKGTAYEGIAEDKSSGAAPGTAGPCHWVLKGLCCP